MSALLVNSCTCNKCKEIKSTDDFYKDKRSKLKDYYRQPCKKCTLELKNNKIKEYRKNNINNILKYLGGTFTCSSCTFTHNTSAPFDWHHIDSTTKEFNISNALQHSKWEVVEKELNKCVFLCKNCHAIEHERLRGINGK